MSAPSLVPVAAAPPARDPAPNWRVVFLVTPRAVRDANPLTHAVDVYGVDRTDAIAKARQRVGFTHYRCTYSHADPLPTTPTPTP